MIYPTLSGAITSFLMDKSAAGKSNHTLADYNNYLSLFARYLKDPDIDHVSSDDLRNFLIYLQQEYKIKRNGRDTDQSLSKKTVSNIQSTLHTFWGWVEEKFKLEDPCDFERVKFSTKPVNPLTEEEVQAMFHAVDEPFRAQRKGQEEYEFFRNTRKRNRAVMFTLLDTGARATGICTTRCRHLDIATGRLEVTGKGHKTRFVYLGKVARVLSGGTCWNAFHVESCQMMSLFSWTRC